MKDGTWKSGVAYEHYASSFDNVALLRTQAMDELQYKVCKKILRHGVHWYPMNVPSEEKSKRKQIKFAKLKGHFTRIFKTQSKSEKIGSLASFLAPVPVGSINQIDGSYIIPEYKDGYLLYLISNFPALDEKYIISIAEYIAENPHVLDSDLTLEHFTDGGCASVCLQVLIK